MEDSQSSSKIRRCRPLPADERWVDTGTLLATRKNITIKQPRLLRHSCFALRRTTQPAKNRTRHRRFSIPRNPRVASPNYHRTKPIKRPPRRAVPVGQSATRRLARTTINLAGHRTTLRAPRPRRSPSSHAPTIKRPAPPSAICRVDFRPHRTPAATPSDFTPQTKRRTQAQEAACDSEAAPAGGRRVCPSFFLHNCWRKILIMRTCLLVARAVIQSTDVRLPTSRSLI